MMCTYNNNIPVSIPSHPYILLDRNILCNCNIEAENNFLLKSLAICDEHKKPDLEMYFMVNLAFMDYLAQLNVTLNTPINRNWMSVKQPNPISLDSFQINPKLMPAPLMLKYFMEQYRENRMTITKQENSKSKFWKFINSFLVDTLIFIAAILTVILALVIIYILTGQSKLKALISTITLQRIKAVEALKTDKPVQNCNSGLLKILKTLNLVIVVSLLLRKIKKNILFWGQPFSNMVKVKLFLADTKSYVSLNLNQSAGNMHLFKLMGELSPNNVVLKKNFIWDVLEVKWGNTCITLNNKEIHLPTTLLVPLIHKIKVRKLFDKINLMNIYIMLKQRKFWYNLECEWGYHSTLKCTTEGILVSLSFMIFTYTCTILPLKFHFRMTFNKSLNATCDLNEYLFCKMPEGTLEVEVKVKTTWEKFTMVQNTQTMKEKYHTWEKAQRCHIKSRKERTPCKAASVHTEDITSETEIPTGQQFGYPPQIFTDPTYTAAMAHTGSEGEVKQGTNFLGRYCEYCNRCGETCCWCFSSNWEEGLNINNPNSNPSVEMIPSPTVGKPHVGWSKSRCTIIKATDKTRPPLPTEEVSANSGTSMQWLFTVQFGGG